MRAPEGGQWLQDLNPLSDGTLLRALGAAHSCTLELAIRRLEYSYAVVGLTEEPELTVRLLEARLPRWFRNASTIANRMSHSKTTKNVNSLTNTTMTGCISKTAVALLAQHAIGYSHEVAFYATAKCLFWRRAAEAGLLSGLRSFESLRAAFPSYET